MATRARHPRLLHPLRQPGARACRGHPGRAGGHRDRAAHRLGHGRDQHHGAGARLGRRPRGGADAPLHEHRQAVRRGAAALRRARPRWSSRATSTAMRAAIRPNTKLIMLETPANPTLVLTDLRAVAALARERGILTIVDNTFASPLNQQPHRAGHRHRRAQRDQAARRPPRPHRRRGLLLERAGREDLAHAHHARLGALADGRLAAAARPAHAGRARGAHQRQRAGSWRAGWSSSRRSSGCTTRAWRATRSMRWRSAR